MRHNKSCSNLLRWLQPVVALAVVAAGVSGQTKTDLNLPDLFLMKQDIKAQARPTLEAPAVPMDAPLNPAEYYTGPGDVVALNIWSSSPIEHRLTVTPEGFLLIPNVGVVSVRDLTLDAVKSRVADVVGKKYPNSQVSLTLLSPRKVSVEISGYVMNEAKFEVYSVARVDNLIETANAMPPTQITREYYEQILPSLRASASQRHIVLHRKDGTNRRVDLIKYQLTGDGRYNPYLREGDIIWVPPRRDQDNTIGVLGGVLKPRMIEFAEGDSLNELVLLGFGYRPLADSGHAVLTRLSPDGRQMDTLGVSLAAVMAGRAANIALRPGDRLVVPAAPELREGNRVIVEGEVVQPGTYPITKDNTRLSEVLSAAGGFTRRAYIPGAVLYRLRLSPLLTREELEQEQLLSMRTSLPYQDSSYYLTETALRIRGEMVSVDFNRLFLEGDSTADVYLRNYDRIVIPPRLGTVYVFGQVLSPGNIPHVPEEGYGYYIDRAGGFTGSARTGDVKVIKGTTRAWLDPGETSIEDGDYIWVPKEPYHPVLYYLTVYSQLAAIITAAVSLVFLIKVVK